MRVDHVVPYIGDQSSGPAQSVPGLCIGLSHCGVQVELHALSPLPPDLWPFVKHGYPWCAFPYRPLGVSKHMRDALCMRAKAVDIIHNNSLWMMPNIYPGVAVRNTSCKLVTAPRGTLSEYSMRRSSWKKAIMMRLGQRAALERTDMFHATSEAELGDIRRLGWRQPVAIVPNGINIPQLESVDLAERKSHEPRILLYLSRLHPEKRLDNLLKAWREIEPHFSDWDLWICGPQEGAYPQAMVDLSRALQLKHAWFKGEVLGAAKTSVYCMADLFVLPTNTENFGMVVAEALACGTPAIVTKGAPWSGLVVNRCGWWIDNGVDALRESLIRAMALPQDELRAMGQRGREWMEREYSWDMQADKMRRAYEWVLYGGKKPDFVSLV